MPATDIPFCTSHLTKDTLHKEVLEFKIEKIKFTHFKPFNSL